MDTEKILNGGVCTPLGFAAGVAAADIKGNKSGRNDLAVLISDVPCNTACIFTKNLVQAAPVQYSKMLVNEGCEVWGVMVNSGNANACTGIDGYNAAASLAEKLEELLEIPEKSLFVSSTGVIGKSMPLDRILTNLEKLSESVDDDMGGEFAKAIMTTDTFDKQVAVLVNTSKGSYVIGGACKGAGMIDPSMATFLGFITTDAALSPQHLSSALNAAADQTFNRITVDGDMSTNDSLMIFANGMSGIKVESENDIEVFRKALQCVCKELALMVVRDGEGATKLVTIEVVNAATGADAKLCASKIANSPLVKTMFAGCDPNWGRLMSSAGASGAKFDPDKTAIYFNDLQYVRNGMILDEKLEKDVYNIMKCSEYIITIDLAAGASGYFCYTCDMTAEYVKINADYRS